MKTDVILGKGIDELCDTTIIGKDIIAEDTIII
jgi:hypothetical protein